MFWLHRVTFTEHKEHKSTQDTHNQESSTPNGAKSSHNTKDKKNRHPITSKLITMTYFKSTTDKVHSAVGSLRMCCLKTALCGQNM
jgi:hypothetical protein